MGIVVCIVMLLGLLQLLFRWQYGQLWVAALLLGCGLWNVLWYGLQHWRDFWGQAALLSGLFMVLAAQRILAERRFVAKEPVERGRVAYRRFVTLGLFLSFALYAVTLVQLNLGLPIIR